MSAETKVFIERELMRKDFKYIVDTLKIGFTDVYAQIVQGKYDITIRPIETSVGGRNAYRITFAGKYDFTNHAFTDIEIKVYDRNAANPEPILGGRSVRISNPSSIFIKSFKERFAEIGYYIAAAENVIGQSAGQGDITIDFVNKTVTIDGRTLPVDTSSIE